MRLFLVRHGLTDHNSAGRFMGHTDAELSLEGFRQVEKLRARLAEEKLDVIYSSDLRRTMVTAEVIASAHKDIEIVRCPELREVNYGQAECLTFEEIKKQYPDLAQAIREFNCPSIKFPGGENWEAFTERALKFRDRLNAHKPDHKILIVSHGGPIRTLLCDIIGVGQAHWRTFRVDNASLSILDTYQQRVILSLLNDTSHLKEGPRDEED